jgi:hypothetical protein
MALPLLMLGLGMLGGGAQFLLNNQVQAARQQKRQQEMGYLDQWFQGQSGQQMAQMDPGAVQNAFAQGAAGGDIVEILQGLEQRRQALGGLQLDAQQRAQELTVAEQRDAAEDWEQIAKVHSVSQRAWQQFINTMETGSASDMVAGSIAIAKLLDPGSVVRENEAGQWEGTGDIASRFANTFEKMRGSSDADLRRELLKTGFSVYKPFNEELLRAKEGMDKRLQGFSEQNRVQLRPGQVYTQGLNLDPVVDPLGSTRTRTTVDDTGDGGDTEPPPPPGFTLEPPPRRNSKSVRELRRGR